MLMRIHLPMFNFASTRCRAVLNRFTPNAGKDYIHGCKGFASYS